MDFITIAVDLILVIIIIKLWYEPQKDSSYLP